MFTFTNFTLPDLTEALGTLRKLGLGAVSMEETATRMVRFIQEGFLDRDTGSRSCALVRFFVTRPYGMLDAELQSLARTMLGDIPALPTHKCLVLLGTAGEQPAWNVRQHSQRHQVFPLPSEQIVSSLPMISQLMAQLGIDVRCVLRPDPTTLLVAEQQTYNVFHVAVAQGSPHIPAQQSFVIPYHIKSVLGFGGLLPSGELFTLILFSRTIISQDTALLFRPCALAAKAALLPFDRDGRIFTRPSLPGHASLTPIAPTPEQLRSESFVLEQLLDIYERTVHEQASRLDRAVIEAQASTRAKSAFLAVMSHEIRTPMNGIMGMTELLLQTSLTAEQREYATMVRQSNEGLLAIINDILDFSRFEADGLTLEVIDFDLRTTLEEALNVLAEPAQRKGLELACLLHAEVPVALRGDPGRLRQVLMNLVGNALKFTHQGEIVIAIRQCERDADRVLLEFAVTDTGIGIAPEKQALLFKPFSQADTSTTREFGGTGLGLAICKQLVERMGGQISLESLAGHGSTFRFTVWLAKQPAQDQGHAMARESLCGRRACIVDDNATSRRILEEYSASWGLETASAADGVAGLALIKDAVARGAPFDVAILDLQMPHMDGLEVARAITADHVLRTCKIILLTSIGVRGQADQAKQSGVAAFLTKPVHRPLLHDCLCTLVGRTREALAGAVEGRAPVRGEERLLTRHVLNEVSIATRPRILVAEDNIVNQKVAVGQLTKLGYRPDVVNTGREAVDAVSRVDYVLIFMDCLMPDMDGFEATTLIRQHECGRGKKRCPIIAMTANAMPEDREKCLSAGMDDYLSKPVKLTDLARLLTRWLPEPPPADG
jgi:signal transduction histidine kinase/CheY-like chemotaxis protein